MRRHPVACARIKVGVYIPRGINSGVTADTISTILSNLNISVQTLCISVDHGTLDLQISEKTILQSYCGDITVIGYEAENGRALGQRSKFTWPDPPQVPHTTTTPVTPKDRGFVSKSLRAKTLTGQVFIDPLILTPGLADSAHFETTSGAIRVGVRPTEESSTYPVPANLTIRTVSGHVQVNSASRAVLPQYPFPRYGHHPPPPDEDEDDDEAFLWQPQLPSSLRRVNTRISTTTGRIFGDALLSEGSILDVVSFSGNIDPLHVYVPLSKAGNTPMNPAVVKTDTKTGKTRVKVKPAEGRASKGKLVVKGRHISVQGKVEAVYNERWEGGIMGITLNGEVEVGGQGVRILGETEEGDNLLKRDVATTNTTADEDKQKEAPGEAEGSEDTEDDFSIWHVVRAHKGSSKASGLVELQTVTGTVDFFVGRRRWSGVLELAREKFKKLLKKVGCLSKPGKNAKGGKKVEMVDVTVQTESEIDGERVGEELTLVEAEVGMGVPSAEDEEENKKNSGSGPATTSPMNDAKGGDKAINELNATRTRDTYITE